MNWRDRANVIRRFYAGRTASHRVGSAIERRGGGSPRALLVDRGVNMITAYHEAGESDEAFAALSHGAAALTAAAARLDRGGEAAEGSVLATVRMRVELMYDAKTAERLIVAFECGCGPAGRPESRRD